MGSHEVRRKGPALATSPCSVKGRAAQGEGSPRVNAAAESKSQVPEVSIYAAPRRHVSPYHTGTPRGPREQLQAQPDPNFCKNIIGFPSPLLPSQMLPFLYVQFLQVSSSWFVCLMFSSLSTKSQTGLWMILFSSCFIYHIISPSRLFILQYYYVLY